MWRYIYLDSEPFRIQAVISPSSLPNLFRKNNEMQLLPIAFAALSLAPRAHAWGAYGHETVAYVASNFVSATTATYFQSLLGDTSANYLASVASFADSYRYTSAGKFSEPFHFVDARDSPPSSCSVDYSRDCGADGCIISALQNYVGSYSTCPGSATRESDEGRRPAGCSTPA